MSEPRYASLRRRWNAAFAAILVVALGVGLAGAQSLRQLAQGTRRTADEQRWELTLIARLRQALTAEEVAAHSLVDRGAPGATDFGAADSSAGRVFDDLERTFDDRDEQAVAAAVRRTWDGIFVPYRGYAADPATLPSGAHDAVIPLHDALGKAMATLDQQVDELERTSLTELDRESNRATQAERRHARLLYTLVGASLLLIVYFGRRLRRGVIRPIQQLRDAAVRLGAGHFDERVEPVAHDEIGDLAEAFNSMATALDAGRRELHHRAFHDPLTGLGNRALLQTRADHALERLARRGGIVGLILLDLDDFKSINDTLGHRAGDALLESVAERLGRCTRTADTLVRLGGDEFAVLLEDLADRYEAVTVAERIIADLDSRFTFEGRAFPVSASLGLSFVDAGCTSVEDLVRDADVAMYITKNRGKGGYTVFEPAMHLVVRHRLQLKADLAVALGTDQLTLHYQPIVTLPSGTVVGVEALARWEHPTFGAIPPAEFIPLAEESGLIEPLGQWVLETACGQLRHWQLAGDVPPSLRLSVNVAARQLAQPGFVEQVAGTIDHFGLDPQRLVLEITETTLTANLDEALATLRRLKRLGVGLAIDDFGTGYSSLSALHELPFDILKIDKAFVDGLDGDSERAIFARAIVGLGCSLHLVTVAEGVETGGQADELARLDCALAQGFFFARPMPHDEIPALFHTLDRWGVDRIRT